MTGARDRTEDAGTPSPARTAWMPEAAQGGLQLGHGVVLEEVEEGLLVRQHDDAYVARGWRLSANTIELVTTALESGLTWMIREGHPQAHARWPSGRGRVYLAFSPTRTDQWSVAIDTVTPGGDDYGKAVFNGKYHRQFRERDVPYAFEKRNRGAGHMEVARPHVLDVIRMMPGLDHSALQLGRGDRAAPGFATEYDIQRAILFGWAGTPFGRSWTLVGDEVPVDEGPNPRRIDVLARNEFTRDWLVVEVKRAEASPDAVRQLQGYLDTLSMREPYRGGNLVGAIMAERVPDHVRALVRAAQMTAYEATHPLRLNRIA